MKASGHVDRFADFVVYDDNKKCYRADHLAKKWFESNKMDNLALQVDSFDMITLEQHINSCQMLPNATYPLVVQRKKLMFEVGSDNLNFLRPEIAQGIFVNFKQCHNFLQKDLPFGLAQVGIPNLHALHVNRGGFSLFHRENFWAFSPKAIPEIYFGDRSIFPERSFTTIFYQITRIQSSRNRILFRSGK